MVHALTVEFVDHVQTYCILQGDPQHAFVPAGSHDEIDISLVPRRWPVSEEGAKPPEPGFCVKSGSSDSTERHSCMEQTPRGRE